MNLMSIPCVNNYLSLIAHFHYRIFYLGQAITEKEEGRWSDIGFGESGRRRKAPGGNVLSAPYSSYETKRHV